MEFLQPRLDDADQLVVDCGGKTEELQGLVDSNFPRWAQGISDKIDILVELHAEKALPGEDFATFLARIRQEFDDLKNDELIPLEDPGFDLPVVSAECPEDV